MQRSLHTNRPIITIINENIFKKVFDNMIINMEDIDHLYVACQICWTK